MSLRRLRPRLSRLIALLVAAIAMAPAAVLVAGPAVAVGAPRGIDARLTPSLLMQGRITVAIRVRGERPGERVTRRWTVTSSGCGRVWCRTLRLVRERGDGRMSRLTLRRVSPGTYSGEGRFFVGLSCLGRTHPRGEVVPYRITLRITRAQTIESVRFAERVSAVYTNPGRVDTTICPLGPSRDAAVYGGAPSPAPGPPGAAFTSVVDPATDAGAFSDVSRPGGDGAPIVSRSWNFGDPASGAANTATGSTATHTFSAPGSYTVTLTVTDADGLSATAQQTVVAPGPPTANFSAQPTSVPLTVAFSDSSTPGAGGAALTAWSWNFGDPASGPADTSTAENPDHTFSAPGTYTVCLTVTDARGRQGTHCAPVPVPG